MRKNETDTEPLDDRFKAFGYALSSCTVLYILREMPLHTDLLCTFKVISAKGEMAILGRLCSKNDPEP